MLALVLSKSESDVSQNVILIQAFITSRTNLQDVNFDSHYSCFSFFQSELTILPKLGLTHSPPVPFGTLIQLTVGGNNAWGYIDTGNILALINLRCMLSD